MFSSVLVLMVERIRTEGTWPVVEGREEEKGKEELQDPRGELESQG